MEVDCTPSGAQCQSRKVGSSVSPGSTVYTTTELEAQQGSVIPPRSQGTDLVKSRYNSAAIPPPQEGSHGRLRGFFSVDPEVNPHRERAFPSL